MDEYIADTHALFWYLTRLPRLGTNALEAFRQGERGEARIYVPGIVVAELYYLNEKLGQPLDFADEFARIDSAWQFAFVDFGARDVLHFESLRAIPEMHDRIIAGVALSLGCPCLTRDPAIVGSGLITTIW